MQNKPPRNTSVQKSRIDPYQIIKQKIINGELKPGEPLIETYLCKLLGISRTPIRSALVKLESENLVVIEKNKGAKVTDINLNILYEAYKVRLALEKVVLEECLKKASFEDICVLELNLKAQKQSSSINNYDEFIALDEQFHGLIIKISGFEQVSSMIAMLRSAVDRIRYITDKSSSQVKRLIEQHEAIFKTIKARDQQRAQEFIEKHLDELLQSIYKYAQRKELQ